VKKIYALSLIVIFALILTSCVYDKQARFVPRTYRGVSHNTYSHHIQTMYGSAIATPIIVDVIVNENTILDIVAVHHGDTVIFFNFAFTQIRDHILENNGFDGVLNTVIGATFTSYGIFEAISQAINEATK